MSFGEELKRERKLREISLREISESTKISRRYLEALERDDFVNLPGGVFNRGFVRAYSQFIGVDPESMVDAYTLQENTQRGAQRNGESADAATTGKRLIWVGWILGALVLAAAAYWGWTQWRVPADPAATTPAIEEAT